MRTFVFTILAGLYGFLPLSKAQTISDGSQLNNIISSLSGRDADVILNSDITLPAAPDIINGSLTINGGSDKFSIKGNNLSGFKINGADSQLILRNLGMTGFNGEDTILKTTESAQIKSIENVNFHDNHIASLKNNLTGGLWNTDKEINKISGIFENNTITAGDESNTPSGYARGAVFYHNDYKSSIESVEGEFNNNTASSSLNSAQGGAFYINNGTINNLHANFKENNVASRTLYAEGGAFFNKGNITDLSGQYFNNNAVSEDNKATAGAIYNSGVIEKIHDSIFRNNYAQTDYQYNAQGGAIYGSTIRSGIDLLKNSLFENNYVINTGGNAYGGAIATDSDHYLNKIENSVFKNNYVQTDKEAKSAQGGALYLATKNQTFNIGANNGETLFSGNYVQDSSGNKTANALYLAGKKQNLNLMATAGGTLRFDDGIDSSQEYNLTIGGDSTGEIIVNDAIKNAAKVTVSDGVTLTVGIYTDSLGHREGSFDNTDFKLDNGTLNLENDQFQNLNFKSFSSTADAVIKFDANLATGESDRINATVTAGSELSIDKINLLGDGSQSIELFSGGNGPHINNLNNFAAFTKKFKYTFSRNDDGILRVADTIAISGLNAAVNDTTDIRSYSMTENEQPLANLGTLQGNGSKLTIIGNNYKLDGTNTANNGKFSGVEIKNGQNLVLENIAVIENFHSQNGGFVNNGGKLEITDTSFKNNTAENQGGAVWSDQDVTITATADKKVSFSGNTADGTSNAIHLANANAALNLNAGNNAVIAFDDAVSGKTGYSVNISGSETGKVILNNQIDGAGTITISGTKVLLQADHLLNGSGLVLKGGELRFDNGSSDSNIILASLTGGNGIIHFDVDTFQGKADTINVEDLFGTVKVVAHNIEPPVTKNSDSVAEKDLIKFAEVARHNEGLFEILRVEGSAYSWRAQSQTRDDGTTDWFMQIVSDADKRPIITAETVAYLGLNSAAFEQTRSVVRNVESKLAANMVRYNCCGGFYDRYYSGTPLINLWAAPVYNSVKIRKPTDFDADIYGLEAGADVQADPYNRYGIFASYRRGRYDFSGKTAWLNSLVSSDINIDSYLGGLYYRYSYGNFWAMGTIFGGIQQADIKTADGIKANTDAVEFGARISSGKAYNLRPGFTVEPGLSASYTQIAYDKIRDDYGKEAHFGNTAEIELEAGVKFEKSLLSDFEYNKIYFKPSLVQTIALDDKVKITGFNSSETLKDRTLGRIEAGFTTNLNDKWSAFGSAGYTFGNGYQDTAINIGINYAF